MTDKKRKHATTQAIQIYRPRVNHAPPIAVPEHRVNPMSGVISYSIMLVVIIFIVAGAVWAFLKFNGSPAVAAVPPAATLPVEWTRTLEPTATMPPRPMASPAPVSKVSRDGKDFIMALEGLSLAPYEDAGGRCTVGYGHLLNDGPCSGYGPISQAKALDFFDGDVAHTEDILNDDLKEVSLTQCQYDSLASFVFNVGPYVWRMSSVIVAIRLGDIHDVSYELQHYIYPAGGGNPLSSLMMRRKAEGRLFDECRYRGS